MTQKEHWRYIPGYEKLYAVSTHGRVISLRKGSLLPLRRHVYSKGPHAAPRYLYPYVRLQLSGSIKDVKVHKLVLEAFRGPRPPGAQSRHLDGNPCNNRLDNLVWGTHKENMIDRLEHGRWEVLTPELVRQMRSSSKTGYRWALELGCGRTTTEYAIKGRTWADV